VSFGQTVPSAGSRFANEDDIREVVIRKLMEDWYKSGDKSEAQAKNHTDKEIAAHLNFKVFFVSVNGRDPDRQFLDRFRDIPRTIKGVSQSKISKHRLAVVDRKTGQFGIIFSADEIHWKDASSVEVQGGYHCDGRCAAGETYELRREHGKWILKSARMNWIS